MKKMILIFALAANLTISAQTRKGFFLSPDLNYGISNITNMDFGPDLSYNVGIKAGYMFGNRAGLYTGLSLSQFNFVSDDGFVNTVYFKMNYVEIPFGMRLITSKLNKFGFSMDAGLNLYILQDGSAYHSQLNTEQTGTEFYTTMGGKFNINPGIHIPVKKRSSFQVGPYFGFYTGQFFDESIQTEGNIITFGLRLAYMVNFYRAK